MKNSYITARYLCHNPFIISTAFHPVILMISYNIRKVALLSQKGRAMLHVCQ